MKQSATGSAHPLPRRRFLKGGMLAAGIASAVPGLWRTSVFAADRERDRNGLGRDPQDDDREITKGDIAILRFLAAAELLETDLWQQYAELAGTNAPESGYRSAIEVLDEDMPDYIADNTDDESHAPFSGRAFRRARSSGPRRRPARR